jgi:putative chitinase
MTITKDTLIKLCPAAKNSKLDLDLMAKLINEAFDSNEVFNTENRKAGFLAQTAHESGSFIRIVENLNYSKDGLLATFPKYFDATTAEQYARKPDKIANRVYANRMGNGDEASGDGWKFKGRGLIQLTGKTNYTNCGKFYDMDLVSNSAFLETVEGAVKSAIWFWTQNKIYQYADKDDIKAMTKAINGGYKGLEERTHLYELAKTIL